MSETLSPMKRVLAALGHREPDRVPFFLFLTMHGARELGISIREYFASARNVVEGQLRLRARFRHDCLYAFFYAPIEIEAWGGEVVYVDDGPPNTGRAFLSTLSAVKQLEAPRVRDCPCLQKVLDAIRSLRQRAGDGVPVIGVVMSPFSLPVMQLGFERYLDMIYDRRDLLERLLKVNEEFTVEWANAQLAAGATAICYFDPVSSSTIIPPEVYVDTGLIAARRTIPRIKGPTATHFASGRCREILEDVAKTGTVAVGVSVLEKLSDLKRVCPPGLSLVGNLDALEMRRWSPGLAEINVRKAIRDAGRGGGFILADNHGEIPWQVPDEVLLAISEAVHKWGYYPLEDEPP